jgi:hypothetical protein
LRGVEGSGGGKRRGARGTARCGEGGLYGSFMVGTILNGGGKNKKRVIN